MEFKMLQNATICNLRKNLFIKCLSIAVKEQIIYLVFIKKLNKKKHKSHLCYCELYKKSKTSLRKSSALEFYSFTLSLQSTLTLTIVIVLAFYLLLLRSILIIVISFLLWALVSRRPCHLVLLLEPPSSICEPGGDLRQGHFSDNGQHDLLSFSRIWVLPVLL